MPRSPIDKWIIRFAIFVAIFFWSGFWFHLGMEHMGVKCARKTLYTIDVEHEESRAVHYIVNNAFYYKTILCE